MIDNETILSLIDGLKDLFINAPYLILFVFYKSIKEFFDAKTKEKNELSKFLKSVNDTQVKHNTLLESIVQTLKSHEFRLNGINKSPS